jgi:hypothetical protein
VLDVGINRIEVDGKKRLVGDVDFDAAEPRASYITPVPGGVGPMTITGLLWNTVQSGAAIVGDGRAAAGGAERLNGVRRQAPYSVHGQIQGSHRQTAHTVQSE